MQLTLLIPELIWPEPAAGVLDALDCPALETLLARSRLTRRPPQSFEATLADDFGQPPDAPYAAFRLLGEPFAAAQAGGDAGAAIAVDDDGWLCSDPVHLRYHQGQLILADSDSFAITLGEAQALADELNGQLPGIGRFHVATAGRWYLQLADRSLAQGFSTPPLSTVAGRRIEELLPETPPARRLRTLLNEAQMVLHAHPINQAREESGAMVVNSLWLWGAGTLPPRLESDFDGLWSGDPLALGLARAAGVPTHPRPADAATFFDHAAAETSHLIVLDDAASAVRYEDGGTYHSALGELEGRWFAPLRAALASGKLSRLRIEASTAYAVLDWESSRRDQWKLWRRARPLAALAGELAAAT